MGVEIKIREILVRAMLLALPLILPGYVSADMNVGKVTATPTNSGIWISAAYDGDTDNDNTLKIYWKVSGTPYWPDEAQYMLSHASSPYIQKITGLANGTRYDVRVEFIDTVVTGQKAVMFRNVIPSRQIHNSDNATFDSNKWQSVGGWGIPGGKYGLFSCETCHQRGTPNIKRVKDVLLASNGDFFPGGAVNFQGLTEFGDDSDNHMTSSRICETCHSRTEYHRYDTDGRPVKTHYNNTDCVQQCHLHSDGFSHGGGVAASGQCIECHGHDEGYQYSQGLYSLGKGSFKSHSTHTENDADDLKGPNIGCDGCHDTNNFPYFKSGVDADGDGRYSLAETDVCNGCHSEGGSYKGVSDAVVGAKANWKTGIYEADGKTLMSGKERWCATCHDESPSSINGVNAPNVVGDEDEAYNYGTGWGFYKTGHGLPSALTYPASGGVTAGAGLSCANCHDFSVAHVDGNARTFDCIDGCNQTEYRSGYRLKLVNGQEPMQIPLTGTGNSSGQFRLCYSCHESGRFTDSGNMNTNFKTDGVNRHEYHLNFAYQLRYPADYNFSSIANSRISCVTCHNVHGSTRLAMVNDGKLTGREPGLEIWYRNDAITAWNANSPNPPVPQSLPLSASTGTLVKYGSSSNLCAHCHGNNNVAGETRAPYQNVGLPPTLEWTGETGYVADGVNPDSGSGPAGFTFRVKYSDANNEPPSAIEVWIDTDDSGTYEAGEKYAMTEADPADTNYLDGKIYTKTLSLSRAGDNTFNYRFYASNSRTASGAPTSDKTVTVVNNAPTLIWTGEPYYVTDGVNPDTGGNGSAFEFRVNYTDLDNDAPSSIQVWVDINDNGIYEENEKFALTGVDGGDTTYSDGKLYAKTLNLQYAGDGQLKYRFYASDGTDQATGNPASDGIVTVNSSSNTPPVIEWAQAVCLTEGVRPGAGARGAGFEFRVKYSDADNQCPASISVTVNGGTYALTDNDGGSCLTGRTYYKTVSIADTGNINYSFAASDGLDTATGQPTGNYVVSVIDTDFKVRPAGGSGWYSTITDAIAASTNPSTIVVYPNNDFNQAAYSGNIVLQNKDNRTLKSVCGPDLTVINGSTAISAQDSANIVVDGFSITGGTSYGVYINRTDGTVFRIRNSKVFSNSYGIYINDSSLVPVEIDNTEIYANTTRGMHLVNANCKASITNSAIHSHNVSGTGAAINMANGNEVVISKSVLRDNVTTGSGGAIYINTGSLTITNSVIAGNQAGLNGGAICTNSGPAVSIVNSTVTGNTANLGGVFYICAAGSTTIRNSIFWNNTAAGGNGANIYKACGTGNIGSISYSDISTASPAVYNASFTDGGGIISPAQDPLFVNPAADNYRLRSGSPCSDAIPQAYYNGPADDIEGISRPQSTGFDIGAYENAP